MANTKNDCFLWEHGFKVLCFISYGELVTTTDLGYLCTVHGWSLPCDIWMTTYREQLLFVDQEAQIPQFSYKSVLSPPLFKLILSSRASGKTVFTEASPPSSMWLPFITDAPVQKVKPAARRAQLHGLTFRSPKNRLNDNVYFNFLCHGSLI